MPRRKQRAELRTRDAAGRRLPQRRQWFSRGIDRQLARLETNFAQSREEGREATEHPHLRGWLLGLEGDWFDEDHFFGADYLPEFELDALLVVLSDLTIRRHLGDAFPDDLLRSPADGEMALRAARDELESRILDPWGADGATVDSGAGRDKVTHAIGSHANLTVIKRITVAAGEPLCAEAILYHAPLWLREPRTFTGSGLRELIDYLFVRYPVPACLYPAWLDYRTDHYPELKWLQWFLAYAQGASLKRLGALGERWTVPNAFQHQFALIPGRMPRVAATVRAYLACLGASEVTAEYLFSARGYVRDLTSRRFPHDAARLEYWHSAVLWIERHKLALTPYTAELLLDWGLHSWTADHRFSWSGRGVAPSLRRAEELRARARYRQPRRWEAQGFDWCSLDGEWSIVELTTDARLRAEGRALQHCVGGYASICAQGVSSVCSLRRHGERFVTIEIELASGDIDQALGLRNRPANDTEMAVIRCWWEDVVKPRCAGAPD